MCRPGDLNWSAYRPGGDNGYLAAMDRWIFHLHERREGSADRET